MARFDVVVIGAGLGGLTAGAILAREGRKVLVIERSNSVGGAASSYKSGDLFIEGSLHKTSEPDDPRDPKHRALMRAGVLDEVKWMPTGSILRGAWRPARRSLRLPDDFDAARDALTERFPRRARRHRFNCSSEMERIASAAGSVARRRIPQSAARASIALMTALPGARTGRCRCRRSSMPCSATTKPSNARSPPTCRIFTTTPPRCGGSFSRWRRAAICRAADVTCRADRSGFPARWPAPSSTAGGEMLLRRVATGIGSMRKAASAAVTHTAKDGSDRRPWNAAA